MTSRLSRTGLAGMIILLALPFAGCGTSSTSDGAKTEDKLRDEKKIQELSKKGYNVSEIRSIMNGQEPPARPKKKAGSSKR